MCRSSSAFWKYFCPIHIIPLLWSQMLDALKEIPRLYKRWQIGCTMLKWFVSGWGKGYVTIKSKKLQCVFMCSCLLCLFTRFQLTGVHIKVYTGSKWQSSGSSMGVHLTTMQMFLHHLSYKIIMPFWIAQSSHIEKILTLFIR